MTRWLRLIEDVFPASVIVSGRVAQRIRPATVEERRAWGWT